jgi:phage baseplate assembly protein W
MQGITYYGKDFFTISEGKDLVAESIIRILMTNFGERVGRPFFGLNLKSRLFELSDDITNEQIRQDLIDNIQNYEPRATITTLELDNTEENLLKLKIGFKLVEETALSDERFININYNLE